MTFINTKGMAFFGPGSEWFWAALQVAALAITFIAIYRQLRIARSASAFRQVEEYRARFDGERMRHERLAILVAIRDGNSIPEPAGEAVGNYFEMLAMLTRNGHLNRKVLWGAMGNSARIWWTVLQPFVKSSQAEWGADTYADFQWLAGAIMGMDRRTGGKFAFDAAWLAKHLPNLIEIDQEAIRVEQALRSIAIASPAGPDTAESATAASAPAPAPAPAPSPQTDG